MNVEEMRDIFDCEQRRDVVYGDATRQVTPRVVRHPPKYGGGGFVLYTELNAGNVEEEIAAQVAFFDEQGVAFEWKVFEHDQPPDLRQRLARHGFEVEDPEAIMVLDLAEQTAASDRTNGYDIRRITDPDDIDALVDVEERIWREDRSVLGDRLRRDLLDDPDGMSIYMIYADGEPASVGWIYFHDDTQFASLWGGSTLPRYRKRGLYTALLSIRKQEATTRGFRFLTVDASPMSEPILARHGFTVITRAWACNWPPGNA